MTPQLDGGENTTLVTTSSDPRIARGMRRVRRERGWSLDDVAALFGCDRSRISRIENHTRRAPDPTIAADLLGVTVDYLLMPCPQCAERPPHGYLCLRCGICQRPVQGATGNPQRTEA